MRILDTASDVTTRYNQVAYTVTDSFTHVFGFCLSHLSMEFWAYTILFHRLTNLLEPLLFSTAQLLH